MFEGSARRTLARWQAGWLSGGAYCLRRFPPCSATAANGSHGQEPSPRRIYGRVCGWRVIHATSLGHMVLTPLWFGLEPGRKKIRLPLGLLL